MLTNLLLTLRWRYVGRLVSRGAIFDSAVRRACEVTMASFCKAVTGTAVMARSANEEKKKKNRCEASMQYRRKLCLLGFRFDGN